MTERAVDRLATEFPLTDAERNLVGRVEAGGPEGWKLFATAVQGKILQAYAAGEITERHALECARRTALGCATAARLTLLGVFAERMLQIKRPKSLNARRPRYPEALRDAAASLVDFIQVQNPSLSPARHSPERTVFEEARELLNPLGLFQAGDVPSAKTLYDWHVDWRKANGRARKRGRPRKQIILP